MKIKRKFDDKVFTVYAFEIEHGTDHEYEYTSKYTLVWFYIFDWNGWGWVDSRDYIAIEE